MAERSKPATRSKPAGRSKAAGAGTKTAAKAKPATRSRAKSKPKTRTPVEVAEAAIGALDAHDLDALGEVQHDDIVDDFVAVGVYRGKATVRRLFEEMLTAIPDFRIEIERLVGDDQVAFASWRASGTFSGGPFLGIEPTGRRLELRGVDLFQVDDGRARHDTIYYDGAAFSRSVGMLPQRDSPAERTMIAGFNAVTRLRARMGR